MNKVLNISCFIIACSLTQLLSMHYPTPNISNDATLLFDAIKNHNNTHALHYMANANLLVTDEQGNSLLHCAIQHNNNCIAKKLLTINDILIYAHNHKNEYPLQIAIKNNNIAIIKFLIKNKLLNPFTTNNGDTTLHLAAYSNNPVIMNILLAKNKSINRCNKNQETPLDIAIKNNNVLTAAILLNHGGITQNVSLTKEILLNLNLIPICLDNNYCNAIYILKNKKLISTEDFTDIFKKYLSEEAIEKNTFFSNNEIYFQIHTALYENNITKAKKLITNPHIEKNRCDSNFDTPLHIATRMENVAIVLMLLNENADVAITNIHGQIPLHIAVEKKNYTLVKDLVNAHSNVNAFDYNHWTPLHYAAQAGNIDIIEYLLFVRANPTKRSDQHDLPQDVALFCNNIDAYKILSEAVSKIT